MQLRSASEETADFLAITAHELHSPVTAMTGARRAAGRALGPTSSEAERAETLRNLASSARRTRRLLDELLMASRLEAGQLEVAVEPVSLATVIAEAVAGADEPVAVGDFDDVIVAADRMRVAQVIGNLLANAARYGQPPITVGAHTGGDAVEIRVCDAGAGIAAELEPRLFKKFIRGAGRRDRGTGLGLFIVRELARRQGGDAWYERAPDGRPCFCFTLPRADVKNG